VNAKIDATLIDNSVILDLIKNDAMDLVYANSRTAVITEEVILEFRRLRPTQSALVEKFDDWLAAQSGRLRIIPKSISEANVTVWDPLWKPNSDPAKLNPGLGDASIRKFLLESAGDGKVYEILTNNLKDFSSEEFTRSFKSALDNMGVSSIAEAAAKNPNDVTWQNRKAAFQVMLEVELHRNSRVDTGLAAYIRRLINDALRRVMTQEAIEMH
jgi:hypothetical protein